MNDADPHRRRIGRGLVELVIGLPFFVAAPLFRHWHMRWGATDDEVRSSMRGDELVVKPSFVATRAITIDAPPSAVWPWIVQMGYGRAGFYTYDLVDNGGYPSADRVLAAYQQVTVGERAFPMNSLFGAELPIDDTNTFRVGAFATDEWLLWQKRDSTWSWLLTKVGNDKTRLVLRIRARSANLFWTVFMEVGDPPMARKMLKGIKARAENVH